MKLQSSSKFQASTLPTILDNFYALQDELQKSRPYLPSQLDKIRQLEIILNNCLYEKNDLIMRQEQLKSILQQKLSIVKFILQDKQNQSYQQGCQLYSQSQKNMKVNAINYRVQKRFRNCRQNEFTPENTQRKFYTATNTPKHQFSDHPNTLQNSRVYSMQTDEEINKTSAFKVIKPRQPKTYQKWYKTPSKTKQKLKQTFLPQNKYQTIEQIWNLSISHPNHPENQKQGSFLQTYL